MFKFRERNGSGHNDSEAPVESVLVPVTGEPSDDELVRMACELVVPRRGMLHMLYVIEIERGFPVDVEIGPATAKGEQVLSHMEELARTFKCKAEAELVQRGAELQTNATVSEIMYEELPLGRVGSPTHKATGVRMEDGTELLADTVISNSTPYVVVARPATCTPHSLLWWRVVGITRSWSCYLA